MKKYLKNPLFYLLILVITAGASLTAVNQIVGNALHTIQSGWVIADSTSSIGDEPTALSDTERTKKLVDAAILAAVSGDGEISILRIPASWNAVSFRNIGITDGGTVTHHIYLGTLGGGRDCALAYSAQLAWTVGLQQSIYDQITFTSGGKYEPKPGDTVIGNVSGATAEIVVIVDSASTWSAGTAAGTVTYKSSSGAFTSGETVSVRRNSDLLSHNAYTHAASDLIDFEYADTLTVTQKAWNKTWTALSPADDTNAEAEVDVKGSDYMVIVTSTSSVDSKLLVAGY